MMELVGLIVLALIAYFLLKRFLAGRSCLLWLVLGLIALVFLARLT